jgi:hypothetical protein
MIDDLVPADADPALVKELVRCLCSRVTAHYLVAHAAEDSPLAAAWRSLGFRRVPRRRIALVAKTLDEPFGPDPFELRNWSLCLGDLEGL